MIKKASIESKLRSGRPSSRRAQQSCLVPVKGIYDTPYRAHLFWIVEAQAAIRYIYP